MIALKLHFMANILPLEVSRKKLLKWTDTFLLFSCFIDTFFRRKIAQNEDNLGRAFVTETPAILCFNNGPKKVQEPLLVEDITGESFSVEQTTWNI